jgi:twinkle protein
MSVEVRGKFVKTHQPCPLCKSSDAAAFREDGSGFCFSCGKSIPGKETKTVENTAHTIQKVLKTFRGITPETYERFKVRMGVPSEGDPYLIFSRPDGTTLQRNMSKKEFWFSGERDETKLPLFGSDLFTSGEAKAVTITEGYFDALAAFQMLGSKYPVLAVQSASSAKAECSKAYDYLNTFDKIYICFDADEAGQEAAKKVALLFDFNKVYLVKLGDLKDANGYLMEGDLRGFEKAWWAAKRFLPEGILSTFAEFDKVIDDDVEKPAVPYPFPTLQAMTYGIRGGEVVLFTALEGIGKTEIFRAIEYHLLKTTESNLGIIHLEEGKARTLKGLAGYELRRPVHLPEWSVSKEELKNVVRKVSGRDERIHIYSHFGSDDPDDLLGTVRFLAGACDCKFVFLDHISMVVSGLQGEDERKALDYLSTRMAMMVEELGFTLFMISHVNDEGQTRGSRNIAKVADLRIDLHRDIKADSLEIRNKTYMTCSKNRFAGKTGPAGILNFDADTFTLEEWDGDLAF